MLVKSSIYQSFSCGRHYCISVIKYQHTYFTAS